jgi:TIR domain/Pentapeptide repeats (8 copies)
MAWFVGGGDVANPEHLEQLKKGVKAWNDWRSANPNVLPDLRMADLSDANLSSADLHYASLRKAELSGASLTGARLGWAGLSGANLSGADLVAADLSRASFGGADLSGANLFSANLLFAKLGAADLKEARMGATVFAGNDLSTTKGLDTVEHRGGSTIGIDTIYKSQGKIPLAFLRGCGVPENFITYMPSLVAEGAIQFYSCFISYSTKDQEFAERLYADLQNKGVRCWFAPHDIQGGKFLDEQIDAAIRLNEKVLLILSSDSIHSDWVQVEVGKAREREAKEGKRVLFPVRLVEHEEVLAALRDWALYHGKEGKDAAGEIRRFYIPDFSRWKEHDLYKAEFEKLVRDLRVEGDA